MSRCCRCIPVPSQLALCVQGMWPLLCAVAGTLSEQHNMPPHPPSPAHRWTTSWPTCGQTRPSHPAGSRCRAAGRQSQTVVASRTKVRCAACKGLLGCPALPAALPEANLAEHCFSCVARSSPLPANRCLSTCIIAVESALVQAAGPGAPDSAAAAAAASLPEVSSRPREAGGDYFPGFWRQPVPGSQPAGTAPVHGKRPAERGEEEEQAAGGGQERARRVSEVGVAACGLLFLATCAEPCQCTCLPSSLAFHLVLLLLNACHAPPLSAACLQVRFSMPETEVAEEAPAAGAAPLPQQQQQGSGGLTPLVVSPPVLPASAGWAAEGRPGTPAKAKPAALPMPQPPAYSRFGSVGGTEGPELVHALSELHALCVPRTGPTFVCPRNTSACTHSTTCPCHRPSA